MRRNPRCLSRLCGGFLLFILAKPGLAHPLGFWPAVPLASDFTATIASGISYNHLTAGTSAGPLSVHHLRLELGNPSVHLGVGLARDQLISSGETVSSMVRRSGAIAGVNGDYFDIGDSGMPLNIVVKDGHLLRSPSRRVALAIGKGGSARIVRYRWTGSIVLLATRQSYWLAGFNTGLVSNAIVALSSNLGYGAPTPRSGMRQTVVELAPVDESRGTLLITPTQMAVLPARDGRTPYAVKRVLRQEVYDAPVPKGVILLVGRGTAAEWLLRNVDAGMLVQVNLTTDPDWHVLDGAIGGGPLLVHKGQIVDDPYAPVPSDRNHRHPVSAVGISRDGRTMLLVGVDGRQPRVSIGLTQPYLAAYMRWRGAYDAMEFDSGGSVTMVVRLPGTVTPTVVNSPSDGHERPVADALLVFHRVHTPGRPRVIPVSAGGRRIRRCAEGIRGDF